MYGTKRLKKNHKSCIVLKDELCLLRSNSMNTKPKDFIQRRQESAEPQRSIDIKYVYIHEKEVFLIVKLQH